MKRNSIRIGVFGSRRGRALALNAEAAGMTIVAVCDRSEKSLSEWEREGFAGSLYTDFEALLRHDLDAVVIANFFHQHAEYAIRALHAGLHVLCETSACRTLAEGVAVARAAEHSGKIYMLSENFPYFSFYQEMRRLYRSDAIGRVMYAEGDYNNPVPTEVFNRRSTFIGHWRNYLPPTYYCTHALAPLMYMTDTMPVSVNALSIATEDQETYSIKRGDPGHATLCRMDNGAVFRLMGNSLAGKSYYSRLHGTRGLIENSRTSPEYVRVAHEPWDLREDEYTELVYKPEFPFLQEEARKSEHWGGDFYVCHAFAEALRSGRQPYLDVYRALAMSAVGIVAWKSALNNGAPQQVPDFRDENVRLQYEKDDWSPWPEDKRPGQPYSSIRGELIPSNEAVARAEREWNAMKQGRAEP